MKIDISLHDLASALSIIWQPVGGETQGEDAYVYRDYEFSRRGVLHFRVTMKRIAKRCVSILLTAMLHVKL